MASIPKSLRESVRGRANGRCEYCCSPEDHSPASFSVEHILPQSEGGKTTEDNLALSCQGCNNYKYTHTTGIDPVSGEVVRLFHPRIDEWQRYFQWDESSTRIIGLSAVGRATITRLKLNRAHIVTLRETLVQVGKHPTQG